ncbi:hypothetical protein K9M47_00700 [Candidatus Gracilibacteria bacterium]|nr:hypothetical protein [Candidatus Gracilibacteria bacterium]MCF7898351.1 hypothetical protein [Candidatus Paceibacterota bacterium]
MGKILPRKKFFKSSIYSPKLNVGSHIDNVRNSLENLIFSNERESGIILMKKRIKVVVILTLFLMVIGSILSPKGSAEVVTFYPTACLGGWNNPRNAEGEPQTKSNSSESEFTKDNSAVLPSGTHADIYCGGFVGEIEQNTKPTKILISLAWSKGEDVVLGQEIISDSFASSSGEILDSTSTEEVSFTLASSTDIINASSFVSASSSTSTSVSASTTVSTSTSSSTSSEVIVKESTTAGATTTKESSMFGKVIDAVGGALEKILGKGESVPVVSTTTQQSNSPATDTEKPETDEVVGGSASTSVDTAIEPTVKPVVEPVAPPQAEPTVTPPTEEPQTPPAETTPIEPESAPVSFFDSVLEKLSSYFIQKVFAEDGASSTPTVVSATGTALESEVVVPQEVKIEEVLITTTTTPMVTQEKVVQEVIDVKEEIVVTENSNEKVIETVIKTNITETRSKDSVSTSTTSAVSSTSALTSSSTEGSANVSTSTIDENPEFASTTEGTSTKTLLDTALDIITGADKEKESQGDFLEVLYTFDGVVWNSLGKVDESSMKYRTFEIPVVASTSWSDMNQLQIKVQPVDRIDPTPAVYLDGIKAEVLYETTVTHEHPDFERDTIISDETVDNIRIVTIINNDNNQKEVWYMYIEEIIPDVVASSTDLTSSTSTLELGTSTEISTTTLVTATTTEISTTTKSVNISTSTLVKDISITVGTSSNASTTNSTSTATTTLNATTSEKITNVVLPKNKWIQLQVEWSEDNTSIATLVEEIKKVNKVLEEDVLEVEKEEKKLPDFALYIIKKIKGVFLSEVVMQVEKDGQDELWLYDTESNTQEKINIGPASTTLSVGSMLGIKGEHLFWLAKDGLIIYAYNFKNKSLDQMPVPPFDISKGEKARVKFLGTQWTVLIGARGFTFYSTETGEVFSDGDSDALDALRKKLNLDAFLSDEKLSELNYILEEKEEVLETSTTSSAITQ